MAHSRWFRACKYCGDFIDRTDTGNTIVDGWIQVQHTDSSYRHSYLVQDVSWMCDFSSMLSKTVYVWHLLCTRRASQNPDGIHGHVCLYSRRHMEKWRVALQAHGKWNVFVVVVGFTIYPLSRRLGDGNVQIISDLVENGSIEFLTQVLGSYAGVLGKHMFGYKTLEHSTRYSWTCAGVVTHCHAQSGKF